jgi:hypothetical protein
MLREIQNVVQFPDDFPRRIFSDRNFELLVWLADDRNVHGFRLTYDFQSNPRAISWLNGGFFHDRIDLGEESPLANRSPILVPERKPCVGAIVDKYRTVDVELPTAIRDFVRLKLEECARRFEGDPALCRLPGRNDPD